MQKKARLSVRRLVQIAMCVAWISVCAWFVVPALVPITMQTFGIFCVLSLLGGRDGTIALLLYLLLGGFGVPVFAIMQGGFQVLAGVTGGYLVGFLLMSGSYWLLTAFVPMRIQKRFWFDSLAMIPGLLLCYVFGTAWFLICTNLHDAPVTLRQSLQLCVIPFILPDLLKLVLSRFVVDAIRKRLPYWQLEP